MSYHKKKINTRKSIKSTHSKKSLNTNREATEINLS